MRPASGEKERERASECRAWPINHTFVGITLLYTLAFARSKGSPRAPFSPATRLSLSSSSLPSLSISLYRALSLSVAREPSSGQTRELRKDSVSM